MRIIKNTYYIDCAYIHILSRRGADRLAVRRPAVTAETACRTRQRSGEGWIAAAAPALTRAAPRPGGWMAQFARATARPAHHNRWSNLIDGPSVDVSVILCGGLARKRAGRAISTPSLRGRHAQRERTAAARGGGARTGMR